MAFLEKFLRYAVVCMETLFLILFSSYCAFVVALVAGTAISKHNVLALIFAAICWILGKYLMWWQMRRYLK